MNRTVTFAVSLLCLTLRLSASAAEFSHEYEHLKPLEWHVGDWVTEYQAASDSGPIKKGDLVTVHFSLRWSPERSFIMNNSFSEVDGKQVANALEVISWNQEKSVVIHSYYGTWGTGQGAWTKVGDAAQLEWTIRGQYGEFKGTSQATKGVDSWQWQIKNQTHDGKAMPEMPVATFRREAGTPAGDLWEAYRKAAVGKWVGEGKLLSDVPQFQMLENDPFSLQLSIQEEIEGKVITGMQDFQVKSHPSHFPARVVAGWDPDSRQVRLFAFWSGGLVEELFLSSQEGSTFFGTFTAKMPGMATNRWPICLHFPDSDSYEYRILGGPHQGKVLSSWKREKK
jgi:hypothetical protein